MSLPAVGRLSGAQGLSRQGFRVELRQTTKLSQVQGLLRLKAQTVYFVSHQSRKWICKITWCVVDVSAAHVESYPLEWPRAMLLNL